MNVKNGFAALRCRPLRGLCGHGRRRRTPESPHRVDGRSGNLPHLVLSRRDGNKWASMSSCSYFSSGMDALSTLPAKTWVFGGMGAIPALMGAFAP